MKTEIHFLNHSSLLVNYNDQFLLTDPFFFKPAFETWLPVPPAYINPAYLLAISKSVKHFGILISHGHDDHCDDDLLKLFTHCPVFITKFNSPGVQNRLLKIGFKEIYEVNAEETKIGDFEIFGNIDFDFSLDDSVQIINTPDLTVIHANDCWQPYTESYVKQLQQQIKKKAILASQVAIADCFPLNYNSYSSEEKTRLYDDRTLRHVNSVYENAIKLSVKYVLHYAGHIKVFNGNDNILNLTGFVERHLLKTVFLEGCGVELLDALPGEKIIDFEVIHPFRKRYYSEAVLKEASKDFWIEYGKFKYKNVEIKLSQENRAGLLEKFSEEFKQYVLERANAKNFYKEILNSRIIFRVGDDLCSVCEFSQNINSSRVDMEVIWPIEIADQILTGAINFEASYIGFLGTFSVNPPSLNNGHAVRWLSMFGYVWQRNVTSKDS